MLQDKAIKPDARFCTVLHGVPTLTYREEVHSERGGRKDRTDDAPIRWPISHDIFVMILLFVHEVENIDLDGAPPHTYAPMYDTYYLFSFFGGDSKKLKR